MPKVIVGVSGGVDSAVTAALLLEQGYTVEGLFMFNWSEDEDAYCTAAEDYASAQSVCTDLDIPLHRADFSEQYRERVFQYFLDEYRAGRTPSPDLLCNREIKFDLFREHARELGADWVATGHYARLRDERGARRLFTAADPNKDQTYFLAAVRGEDFSDVLFPLGDYTKPEVRDLAVRFGLPNHDRKDSTGICFIGERPMREFLQNYIDTDPGPILTDTGLQVGQHQGLAFYTLGQRRGLGIGGVRNASEAPWFVAEKRRDTNTLVITQNEDHPRLRTDTALLSDLHWIHDIPELPLQCEVRVRHRQPLQEATLQRSDGGRSRLDFAAAQWALSPGQFAVFYRDDECLGCGVIEE